MDIRKSNEKDSNAIMNIYARARRFMADNGNYIQWGPTNWTPQSLISEDIVAGKSYVCIGDQDKFKYTGIIYVTEDSNPRNAYEKL